jgi:integrase
MQGTIKERIRKNARDRQGRVRKELKVYDVKFRYTDSTTGEIKETTKRGFKTKGEAEVFLLDLNNRLVTNTYLPNQPTSMRDYLMDWLEIYVKVNLRRSSYLGYKRIIEKHLIPHLGLFDLKKITSIDIDKMYAYLLQNGRADGKGGLSAKTVLYTHRVLNEAMEQAVKKRLIYYNPVKSVTNVPKPKRFKGNVYSADEILQLLTIVKGTQFEIPVALAAICGLRRGECLALTEDDIDFDNKTISIHKQFLDLDNKATLGEPKSEESNRIISAPPEVFDIIQRHIQCNAKKNEMLSAEYEDHRLLVCHDDGKPIRPVYFTKNFAHMIERNKLKQIRFHDLRHSCASLMLRSGIAMKTASLILRHSAIGITADLYTHVLEDTKKEAAIQIGATLFGKNK